VIDVSSLQFPLLILTGWLDRREREVAAYLMEENRLPPPAQYPTPSVNR